MKEIFGEDFVCFVFLQAVRIMSQKLPETVEQMLQVQHVTQSNYNKYGEALLEVTKSYANRKNGEKSITFFLLIVWLWKEPHFKTGKISCLFY